MEVQKRARNSVSSAARAAHTFIFQRDIAQTANKAMKEARTGIQAFLLPDPENEELNPNSVRIDEKGHRYYDFDAPVEINGVRYKGLRFQRGVSANISLDKVREFFDCLHNGEPDPIWSKAERERRAELKKSVYKPVTTWEWDFEELYRLNQEGKLTDDELDSFTQTNITWSLNVEKA